MYDAMVSPERGCDPDAVPTDCGSKAALPYFVSYTVICMFVLLNLIVAVILENLSALKDVDVNFVSAADVEAFGDAWSAYDQDTEAADGYITEAELADLLLTVPPPLGYKGQKTLRESLVAVHLLRLPRIKDDLLKFDVVVNALISRSYRETGVQTSAQIDQLVEDTITHAAEEASKVPAVDLSNAKTTIKVLDAASRFKESLGRSHPGNGQDLV